MSQVRAGFEMDSDRVCVLNVGTLIDVLEMRQNDSGVLRVRYSRGWVSERAGNGTVILEVISGFEAAAEAAMAQAALAAQRRQMEMAKRQINPQRADQLCIMLDRLKPANFELMPHTAAAKAKANRKSSEKSFDESKRFQISFVDIKIAIRELNENVIDLETAELLLSNCPEPTDIATVNAFEGKTKLLGRAEQYVREVSQVPRLQSRLQTFCYKLAYEEKQHWPYASRLATGIATLETTVETISYSTIEGALRDFEQLERDLEFLQKGLRTVARELKLFEALPEDKKIYRKKIYGKSGDYEFYDEYGNIMSKFVKRVEADILSEADATAQGLEEGLLCVKMRRLKVCTAPVCPCCDLLMSLCPLMPRVHW
eukprot:COSAG05_NODE_4206_length_1622_cov_1.228496_1_plen_371_part_00